MADDRTVVNMLGLTKALCALVVLLMVAALVYAGVIVLSDYGHITV